MEGPLKIKRDDTGAEIVIKLLTKEVMKAIVTRFAWAAVGVVNPLITLVATFFVKIIVLNTSLGIKFFAIDVKVEKEVKAHAEAANELHDAIEKGNEDEIKKAEDEYVNRLRDLIKLRHN